MKILDEITNVSFADIPEDGPVLRTEVQKVAPGAKIRANCTTPGSFPGMNITWFINDVEVSLLINFAIYSGRQTFGAIIS